MRENETLAYLVEHLRLSLANAIESQIKAMHLVREIERVQCLAVEPLERASDNGGAILEAFANLANVDLRIYRCIKSRGQRAAECD